VAPCGSGVVQVVEHGRIARDGAHERLEISGGVTAQQFFCRHISIDERSSLALVVKCPSRKASASPASGWARRPCDPATIGQRQFRLAVGLLEHHQRLLTLIGLLRSGCGRIPETSVVSRIPKNIRRLPVPCSSAGASGKSIIQSTASDGPASGLSRPLHPCRRTRPVEQMCCLDPIKRIVRRRHVGCNRG